MVSKLHEHLSALSGTHAMLQVVAAVEALDESRQLLSELQAEVGLGAWNETLLLDLRLAGIVEAWAAGATWQQVRRRRVSPCNSWSEGSAVVPGITCVCVPMLLLGAPAHTSAPSLAPAAHGRRGHGGR